MKYNIKRAHAYFVTKHKKLKNKTSIIDGLVGTHKRLLGGGFGGDGGGGGGRGSGGGRGTDCCSGPQAKDRCVYLSDQIRQLLFLFGLRSLSFDCTNSIPFSVLLFLVVME